MGEMMLRMSSWEMAYWMALAIIEDEERSTQASQARAAAAAKGTVL